MKIFIRKVTKKIIIYFVVCMLFLSNISYGYSQAEVGDAIAGFAAHVVSEYGDQVLYEQLGSYQGDGHTRDDNPIWNPSNYSWDDTSTYYFDCSSYSSGCIHAVTGLLTYALNTSGLIGLSGDPNFEVFRFSGMSDLMPGDVVVHDDASAHAVVYLGQEYSAWGTTGSIGNNGSTFRSESYFGEAYEFYVVRVSEEGASNLTSLNTEFATGNVGSSSNSNVDFSNFYFNGIPDGKYSLAHTSLWTLIVETLAQIADYLIGILTYIVRIPFIGWTAIMDNLLNWTVNTVTDTGVTEEEMGIDSVEVEGADDENRLTIDGLLYNDYQLTNINIFE